MADKEKKVIPRDLKLHEKENSIRAEKYIDQALDYFNDNIDKLYFKQSEFREIWKNMGNPNILDLKGMNFSETLMKEYNIINFETDKNNIWKIDEVIVENAYNIGWSNFKKEVDDKKINDF